VGCGKGAGRNQSKGHTSCHTNGEHSCAGHDQIQKHLVVGIAHSANLVSRTLQRQHIRSLSWARPEALSHPLWLRLRSSIQKRKQADIPVLPATNSGREQRLNRRSAGESTGVCHKPGALGQWQGLSKGHTTCHTNGEHSYAGVEIGGGDQGGAWRYDCSLNGSSTTKGGSCLGQSLIRCD